MAITVFTPTYNREYILERLYESLINQTDPKFEWVIIDDGSTDNTKKLIDKWIKEKKIDIKYKYKKNGGKQSAFNEGIKIAKYELFFCVDSDDFLEETCIEKFNNIFKEIKDKGDIVGIIAYRKNNSIINKYPSNIKRKYIRLAELYAKYNYKGETALAYKTKILRENLFPVINENNFITEDWLYDRLDNLGASYFLQEPVYFGEYLNDGYTKNNVELLRNNIESYLVFAEQRMNIGYCLKTKLKGAVYYNICNFEKKSNIKKYIFHRHVFMILLTLIPSYLYYKKKFQGNK